MKISIIMPTYNGLNKFLKEAIASVMAQDEQDWELLISDDGSNDGTRDYLKSLTDARIRVFLQDKNLGIFGNLNFLFKQAGAELSYILCQDDTFTDPQALNRCLAEWTQQAKDIAFIRFNHQADGFSALTRFEAKAVPYRVEPAQSDLLFFIFGCIPGNLSNVSLRTQVPAQHGWFKPELPYAGDFEFWSRVGSKAPWIVSGTRTTHIRLHSGQASQTLNKRGELVPQLKAVLNELYDRSVERGASPTKLRLFGTICYLSMHRSWGLQALARTRSPIYLKMVKQHLESGRFLMNGVSSWVLFFISAGGRLGRVSAARSLLP